MIGGFQRSPVLRPSRHVMLHLADLVSESSHLGMVAEHKQSRSSAIQTAKRRRSTSIYESTNMARIRHMNEGKAAKAVPVYASDLRGGS